MIGALIKSGLAGGLSVFFWGAISWMVLPWHNATLLKFNEEAAVAKVIEQNTLSSGIYVLPNPHRPSPKSASPTFTPEERDKALALALEDMKRGPVVFMSVLREGSDPQMTSQMLGNFLINCIAATLFALILLQASISGYWKRVQFLVLIAMTGGVISHLPHWIWWGFSASYTAGAIADIGIAWFLAGLLIARFTNLESD